MIFHCFSNGDSLKDGGILFPQVRCGAPFSSLSCRPPWLKHFSLLHLLSSKPFPALMRGVLLAMIQWRTLPRTSSRPPLRRSARTSWVILRHPTLLTLLLGRTPTVIPLKAGSLRRIISSMLRIIRRRHAMSITIATAERTVVLLALFKIMFVVRSCCHALLFSP